MGCLEEEKWTRGILQHRNTPAAGGRSPAQIVFGRSVRDALPAHRRRFAPEWHRVADRAEVRLSERQQRADDLYNSQARDLTPLAVDNQVAVQDDRTKRWDRHGVICEVGPHRRYYVRLSSGRVLTRNRRHLRRRYGHAMPERLVPEVPAASRGSPADQTRESRTSSTGPVSGGAPTAPTPEPYHLRRSTRSRRPPVRLIEEI